MTNSIEVTRPAEAFKKTFTMKVLGVGGAGCNAVGHLAQEKIVGVSFAVLNTDAAALAQSPVETKLNLGVKSMRGMGAGGEPMRGRMAAEEDAPAIRALCQGVDVVFVVAGLGGGTGTGGAPVVAAIARECGALVLGLAILPFDFEGSRRQSKAKFGLDELKTAADGVICLPNQKVFKLIDEKSTLLETLKITNELIAQGVRGIGRLLSKPGQINADFADLCSVLQERHTESSLATVEARGENRSREVMEKLMAHPLIESGQSLNEATGVLVCITAGADLSMTETTRIMEQVSRQCEQAHIVMGVSVEEELTDRLCVTLLAAKGGGNAERGTRNAETTASATMAASIPMVSVLDKPLQLEDPAISSRPTPRFLAPAPTLTPEKTQQLLTQQGVRGRKLTSRMKQGQLPLEIVSRGRFEKSEPTLHQGQNLDVPTYIRRGVALN
jgi:cell division protein FtsZ